MSGSGKSIAFVEQFNPLTNMGGIERFVASLSQYASRDYGVHCVYAQENIALRFPKTVLLPILAAALAGKRCDLVHANWWTGSAAFFKRELGKIPLITTIHGSSHGMLRSAMGRRSSLLKRLALQETRLYEKLGCRISDAVVAVSGQVKSEVAEGYGVSEDKLVVIPNGIDTDFFRPAERERQGKKLVIGAVGRMDSVEKGFPDMLAAYTNARSSNPDIELNVIGRLPELKAEGVKLIQLDYSGMPSAYNSFDIFAQSSLYEGFGMALLEAMASGLPVVTTNVGIAPEVIKDGANGFIVDIGDPAALAERIGRLAADEGLRKRMGAEARKTAESFRFGKMAEAYAALYRRFLGQG